MRIPYEEMNREFVRVLIKYGMDSESAQVSARLFAEASRDGVYTHGLNRFPKFIASVVNGSVDIHARATAGERLGVLERWNGNRGPGNLNAWKCMERAIELAHENTLGCVALSNTNHWMRPGAYGLMAAEAGCIGILWTNTIPNMPAWGGKNAVLGNNPVVVCIPHKDKPVLVDVAMSMFSYGKLESYARQGKELPVDGGFDKDGNITKDAARIQESHQPLPIGYWKGSGLSLVLDLIAATLAGGRTSYRVAELPTETELSQVFMAIDLDRFPDKDKLLQEIGASLAFVQASEPRQEGAPVYYPGEGMARVRKENMEQGILVDSAIWEKVLRL